MNPQHEHHTPNNGHKDFTGVEAFSDLTYTDPLDDMAGTTNRITPEQIAEILDTQNQLLMWMKTKEISGGDKKPGMTPVLGIVISAIALLVGIIGGLLGSVAVNAQWKGDIEARIKTIEAQRAEDKQEWSYIRTQNEVMGKSLTRIEANQDLQKERKR